MRLTLDLDIEEHRRFKTMAAFHGQTINAFILEERLPGTLKA